MTDKHEAKSTDSIRGVFGCFLVSTRRGNFLTEIWFYLSEISSVTAETAIRSNVVLSLTELSILAVTNAF